MKMEQLLPNPFNSMHAKWLNEPAHAPPPTGCRAATVVHLVNAQNQPVPVRIHVSQVFEY